MAFKSSDRDAVKWLYKSSGPQLGRLAAVMFCNCVYASTSVIFALMCRGVIDGAVDGDRNGIIKYALGLLGVILLQLALRLICNSLEESVKAGLEIGLRDGMLRSVMKKEYSSVAGIHSGEILNRMFSDVQIVSEGVTGILPGFVNMVTRLVCAVAVLIALDRSFTLLFLAAGVVMFAVSKLFRGRIKRLHRTMQSCEGRVRSFLQETVENLLAVKTFGCEDRMSAENGKNQQSYYRARMKKRNVTVFANAGFGFVFQAGYLCAMLWGAGGIYSGAMTYGTLTAILQLVNQIQAPFAGLSGLFPRLYSCLASAERIMELEGLPDEPPAGKTLDYADLRSIEFRNVCFSYGENTVLTDVSVSVSKGEFASLTGISGGGKSTLFLLIMGAYKPDSGEIVFTSSKGDFLPGLETRGLIAYVPQGNILFSGTVAENIAFLKPDASLDEIYAAAETACAAEFIGLLPDGYETAVGENGFGISEGQAQRIAVARALLGGAPMILLDEATSALDEATEAKLLKNIAGLKDKTVLIVTHRPAALKICGKRLLLKDGGIEYGKL